jgi:hypothetical protein
VQVGGVGRSVAGKLVAPPGLEIRNWTNQVTLARLQSEYDSYGMPKNLTGNAQERWKLEFDESEAGRTWSRNQNRYDFNVGADGSFTIPEVLPGKYWLIVNVGQGYLGSGPDSSASRPGEDTQIAQASLRMTVPEASADSGSPLDVGEIVLNATH